VLERSAALEHATARPALRLELERIDRERDEPVAALA
jgi:hypothetical protein